MSISYMPSKVQIRLWGKAAGRCQYEGCNKPLWLDQLTKVEFNTAYIAHIIAYKTNGPRGDEKLSEELKANISNLMLMCDDHHRLIDREDVKGHPVERLSDMKKKHELRIELLTSITENKQSHVILYGANIGNHYAPVSLEKAAGAMLPNWFPAEKPAIELSLKNSPFNDAADSYWNVERANLRQQFNKSIRPRLALGDIAHFSIFALAPQPLLIELGHLLSDIPVAEVYQLHREPPNWTWQEAPERFDYIIYDPGTRNKNVAINLSLSATIDNNRITCILGDDVSIWTLTIETPNNDFLKGRKQLSTFRAIFRQTMDKIKAAHGQKILLHVFPAVPVAVAVEIGRTWMPKADLPLRVYDQNRSSGGFLRAIDIGEIEQGG